MSLFPLPPLLGSSFVMGMVGGAGDLQVENAALKVRVEAVEVELQDGSLRMQQLLEQNAQLEVDRDKK